MGNHEDMLLNYIDYDDNNSLYNGGVQTLYSYDNQVNGCELLNSDIRWMRKLPLYYEDKNGIYVHAGINKGKTMKNQNRDILLWTRENFYQDARKYRKNIIFGHTPTAFINGKHKPIMFNSAIAIDTGCVFGGYLTAVVIDDKKPTCFCTVKKGGSKMKVEKINDYTIDVLTCGFYGNGTGTSIRVSRMDEFILGYLGNVSANDDLSGKVMFRLPESKDIVVIYNELREAENAKNGIKETFKHPELTLHCCCVICTIDENGELHDLTKDCFDKVKKYIAA